MSKMKLAAILAIFLAALISIRFLWFQFQTSPPETSVSGAVLDLRQWDWNKEPEMILNGQWGFYPSNLFVPERGKESPNEGTIVELPSDWKEELGKDEDGAFGYATYRLLLFVNPDEASLFSMRIPAIPASAALYVNGQRVGGSGVPASSAEEYKPGSVPFTANFKANNETGMLDIVIHVANFDDRIMSGIMQPILFGTEEAIRKSQQFSEGTQMAVCILLFMHILYAAALYFIGVRQRALIYFSLLILSATMTILIDDDRLLMSWTSIGYEWNMKLYYLSFLGAAVSILYYAKHLLQRFSIMRFSGWFAAACGLYALFVLLMPARLLSYGDLVHTALILIPYIVIPTLTVKAIFKGEEDLIFILLGAAAVSNNLVWGIIKNTGLFGSGFYPWDTVFAFMMLALYWFKSYFRTANQTAKLAERLQAVDKQKDDFLASTSHELRNPLHGMLNMAESVLQDGRYGTEETETRLRLLVSVGKRMSYMLEDLTELTRFKENGVRLQKGPLHLQAVAGGVLDMLRYMTEGKPVVLINEVPSSLPLVKADENRIVQVLYNLVHNAIKFTERGEIVVHAEAKNGSVHIVIRDTGAGMDEATAARIFQPYQQGEGAVTGLGLGLAISRELVHLHGGELTVKSKLGEGSRFAFALPLYLGAAAAQTSVVQAGPQNSGVILSTAAAEWTNAEGDGTFGARAIVGQEESDDARQKGAGKVKSEDAQSLVHDHGRPRVLAVDDDPVNLKVLSSVLSEERYDITTTTSGNEALPLLETGKWDLVIADVMMPGISGYELTEAVRERFSRSELPVLLLTARGRSEDIAAGFRSGASDYIQKPVDADELRARVEALTEMTKAAKEQAKMEAAWLQAQIEPHFLFNTLSSVAALSEIDQGRMKQLLTAFSQYLRASFNNHNAEGLVPLKKELELVQAYLYIEKERFGDRINVVWEADENLALLLPPLTIQPLVENALKHGILSRSSGGTIRIRTVDGPQEAEVSVSDDGAGISEAELGGLLARGRAEEGKRRGIGLANTHYRLKLHNGSGLCIESTPKVGTTVSFKVVK
ncbi:ATP-binding protein [Paenibacillus sp. GCM10027627]|uniref:hybrid sensor histidine kinase/response regulator n=1 Tax=unclassified Paenibacillus TaxID=185978 RepID=UPI003635F6AA